jgi:NADPH:quinone reductase-like Zn-dependent oxidoreductase
VRAVVLTAYGPAEGLELQEVDKPVPGPGEVLVRVHAATVTAGDSELRTSALPWLFWVPLRLWMGLVRPKPNTVLGMEVAGVVDSVGEGVERFGPGDEVFGATGLGFGAYAEYVRVEAEGILAIKPDEVAFEQAVTVPVGGIAALGYLRKGGIAGGKTVLVRGASGSIGTYAVQLAKHAGAHVTGVCGTEGLARVQALGADVVIDYTTEDFTENGVTYDLMLDVVGRMSISRCLRSVKPGGTYVRGTIPGVWELLVALWAKLTSRKRVVLGDAGDSVEDLVSLGELMAQGELEAVIDRRYPLEETADAHRYVETGHKQGHVVITVA